MLSSKKYRLIPLLLASGLIFTTPQPSYSQEWLPFLRQGLQVIQLSTLSDRQEVQIGQQIHQQLVNSGQIRLSRNQNLYQMVNRIGQRLAQTSSRPNIPYNFYIVEDSSINAFATMGGFIYLNTGVIAAAENEAELASVIAHEISHIAARHSVKQMRQIAMSQGLMSAAGMDQNRMVQLGVQLGVNLPHSREAEFEADQLGLYNLKRAGYAPIGMVSFMQKLAANSRSNVAFLSTHPNTQQRVIALKQSISPQAAYQGDGLNSEAYQQAIRYFLR